MSNIPIIFSVLILTVENCCGVPNENVVVLIVDDIDFLVFFNKKYVGLPPEVEKIDTSVGSPELETEKSIGSYIKKLTLGNVDDLTVEF